MFITSLELTPKRPSRVILVCGNSTLRRRVTLALRPQKNSLFRARTQRRFRIFRPPPQVLAELASQYT